MLPKTLRIKVRDFNKIPQKSIKIFSQSFNLFIKNHNSGAKFVISVPKSLDKRSTKRNYTKRSIEQIILSFNKVYKDSKQILFRAKKIITDANRKATEDELKKILKNEFSN